VEVKGKDRNVRLSFSELHPFRSATSCGSHCRVETRRSRLLRVYTSGISASSPRLTRLQSSGEWIDTAREVLQRCSLQMLEAWRGEVNFRTIGVILLIRQAAR